MGKQLSKAAQDALSYYQNQEVINAPNTELDGSKYLKGFSETNLNSINDYKANKQIWYEGLTNSLVKNTAKAGIRFVDGFGGVATALTDIVTNNSLSSAIEGEDMAAKREGVTGVLETIYDNPFSKNITRPLEAWLDEQLPVYQTEAQQQSYNPLNLGFLDKALDGVAYIAGMAGGAKFATLGAKGLGKAAKFISAAAREGKDLNYVKTLFGESTSLLDDLAKSKNSPVKELATNLWDDMFGAMVESGAEAAETKKTIFENLKNKALAENKGLPLTKEQEAELEKQASVGGAANFLVNMVTTGMANNVVFKPLLKTKWLDDVIGNTAIKNEMINPNFIGKKGTDYILDKTVKNQKLYERLFKSDVTKNILTEGTQEGVQFASNDYFVNLLSEPSKESVDELGDLYAAVTRGGLETFMKTAQNMGSVDAVHSMLIGSLLGGGSSALQNIANRKDIDANTQAAIDYANRNSLNNKDVTEGIKYFAKSKEYAQVADAAVRNGDRLTYETAKYLGFANYINARVSMNKFDDVVSELNELKSVPLDKFKEQFDMTYEKGFDEKKRNEMIDYALAVANQIKTSQTKIMSNFGHKINALEAKNPDNKKLLPFLTSLDILRENYTTRENELIDKFKANGVDYTAFQKKEASDEQIAAKQGNLAELQKQLTDIQGNKDLDPKDKLAQINEISNKIVKASDDLQRTVTEGTYKELFRKELTDEYKPQVDDKTQSFIYETYSKDLNDFVAIQTAKEKLIDFYSRITKDESYAEKVVKKLTARKNDTEIAKMFTVSGNLVNKPKVTKKTNDDGKEEEISEDNYVFEEGQAQGDLGREEYIKTGDVYQLNRSIYGYNKGYSQASNKAAAKNKGETYEMFEVVDTKTTVLPDGSLKGEVQVSNNKGYKEWIDVRDFKKIIKPMGQSATAPIKMNNRSEEYKFYQEYNDRAVRFTRDGVTYIGKIALPRVRTTKDGKLVVKAGTYDIIYLDKDGKQKTIQGISFNNNLNRRLNIKSIEILSKNLSNLIDLKLNAEFYISNLLKTIKTKEEKINNYKQKLKALNANDGSVKNIADDIKQLLATSIANEINTRESDVEVLKDSIKNLKLFADKDEAFDLDNPLPKVIQEALDTVQAYRDSNAQLKESDKQKLLKEKLKLINEERKIIAEKLGEISEAIKASLPKDELTQNILDKNDNLTDALLEIIDSQAESPSKDATFVDLYKQLLTKEIELAEIRKELEDDLYDKIAQETGILSPKAIKLGELDAMISFWNYTTNKGYRYSSGYPKWYSKNFHDDADFDVSVSESDNADESIIKTKAPSDPSKISGKYADEKRNFFKYFYSVPVDNVNPINLEVEVDGDTIYLKFEHNKIPMVTTLQSSVKDGSPLAKFRESLKEAYAKNQADGKKTFITPNGKFSAFQKGSVNKPIQEVFKGIDFDIEVAEGKIGEEDVIMEVNKVFYNVKNGRPYVINRKLGILQPVIVGTLAEAKIKDKKGNVFTLADTIFNYITYIKLSKDKVSDNDYQNRIKSFYMHLNSFVFTANSNSIGTQADMVKGAIDIIEAGGEWSLVYLDADGNKQKIDIFDEDGVSKLAKEQIERRLVNPKLETENFKYDNKFSPFVTFIVNENGLPLPVKLDKDDSYTYATFLKESAGLKSNLEVQDITTNPTYFKGGYFTFDVDSKPVVNINNFSPRRIIKKESAQESAAEIPPVVNTKASRRIIKKKDVTDTTSSFDFGATSAQESAAEEADETSSAEVPPVVNTMASRFSVTKNRFQKEADDKSDDSDNFFNKQSLEIAGTARLRDMTTSELEAARDKFENKYGVNFELVNGLINGRAWGMVTKAGEVFISDTAPLGTDYHEEFHLVSQHMLTKSELNDLYAEARNRYGNLNDYELEELLAEGFRMYALGYNGFVGKIAYYFNKLINGIKLLLGIKGTPIEQLYSDILYGKYYAKPVYEGTVRNSQVLSYDEKQEISSHITKFVLHTIKTAGLDNDKKRFIEFINDSYYREKMINEVLNPEDFNDDPDLKQLIIDNNSNAVASYFAVAVHTYMEHLEKTNPFLATKAYNTFKYSEILSFAKAYFNNVLKTNIEEEIDEEEASTTNDIRKKGDAETDFFTSSLTKLRLLIVNESDGTEFGHLNPATFMSMIYNHIRDANEDISDYNSFKNNLISLLSNKNLADRYGKEYTNGLRNIIRLLDMDKPLSDKTDKHTVNLQNLLFEVFSKVENEFQVLKAISSDEIKNKYNTENINDLKKTIQSLDSELLSKIENEFGVSKAISNDKGIIRAFVNQTIEKQHDAIQKRVRDSIIKELVNGNLTLDSKKRSSAEIARVANQLFGTNIYTESMFSSADYASSKLANSMYHTINHILDGRTSDKPTVKEREQQKAERADNIAKILDYNKSSIDRVVATIATSEGLDKVFNIRNAEGSPQYSLSNYSSAHKRLEDYKKKENPLKSDLEFTKLVLMNGVQTKGNETEGITANKLNQLDILLYYIESVLKNKVLPYAFSGDKSTLLGIKAKGYVFEDDYDFTRVYSKILDKEIAFLQAFEGKEVFQKMKLELPTFEILKLSNSKLYTQLLNAVNNNTLTDNLREEAIKALIKHNEIKGYELAAYIKDKTGVEYAESQLVKFYNIYTTSIAEQTNELTGSLNFYSDFAKRAYALSSTKINLRLDEEFVNWYNSKYSKGLYKINANELKSVVINDVERKAFAAELGDFDNAADAQGYMHYHSARFMLVSSGRWNEKLDMIFKDLDRLEAKTLLTESDISQHNDLIEKLNEQVSVLKPQHFGFQNYNGVDVPTFYKLSVLPLSKVITTGSNLDVVRQLMLKSGVDLVMFESANKVGRRIDNGTISMYDKNGNFNLGRVVKLNVNSYDGNIKPDENTVFVFGANPEFRHGGGAAKVAVDKFGIQNKESKSNNAYGLITKDLMGYGNFDESILEVSAFGGVYYESEGATFWPDSVDYKGVRYQKLDDGTTTVGKLVEGKYRKGSQFERPSYGGKWLHKLPKAFIEVKIREFYEEAANNPDKQYKIAYNDDVNKVLLNGYTGIEMAEMFKAAGDIPNNVLFSKKWVDADLFNKVEKLDENNIEDFLQYSHWKYMGIQVEMPLAHEKVTFGTQFRKLVTESIPDGITLRNYDRPLSGDELIAIHENLILEKIKADTEKFKARFKLKDDFTFGEIVDKKDREEFKKQLIQQATSREVPESFIQALKDNNSWDYIMNKSTLQKILNASIRNNLISQKMTGDAKAMVSSVGFERANKSIDYSNRLQFYSDTNDAIEVLLPYEHRKAFVKYTVFKDGYYQLSPDTPRELTDLIGYRIPTQGHASIDKLRIKGFLPADYGNAIVVPFELSKKAGSDFDIDKLNIFFPKLKNNEYDTESIENKILEFYNDVLSSPEYRKLLMTSIDNSEIKDIITGEIEPAQGSKKLNDGYLMFDPLKAVERRYSFMSAKSTLGSVALHATHHAESQKHKLGIRVRHTVNSRGGALITKVDGVSLIDLLNLFESGRNINNTYKDSDFIPLYNTDSPLVRNGEFVKISDIIGQFINATVDAAKDDYITSANIDMNTINTVLMLIRIGMHPREVLMMVSNNAVKQYAELKRARTDLTYDSSLIDMKLEALISKANNEASFKGLNNETALNSLKETDYGILKTYMALEKWSEKLSDLMNISNFDTKGTGKSIEENEYRQRKFEQSKSDLKTYFHNFDNSINPENSFQSAFREIAFKANNFTGLAFGLNKLYYSKTSDGKPQFPEYYDALNKYAYDEKINVGSTESGFDKLKRLSADERTYRANRFKQMFLTALLQYNIIAKNKFEQPDLKSIYANLKANLPTGYFRNKLLFLDNAEGVSGQQAIVLNEGASLSVDESNRISFAFEELYRNKPELAKDLVIFSIFQSGLMNSPVTLYHILPEHIIKEISAPVGSNDNLFDALMQAGTKYNSKLIGYLVSDVENKLKSSRNKYNNKVADMAVKKGIEICNK